MPAAVAPISPRTDNRWAVLAGLRFLLATVVVSGHLSWFGPPAVPFRGLLLLGGTAAVLGFLVISGYSIAHSLDRRPSGFYRRRVLRIYPLYAAAVLFAVTPFLSGAPALSSPDLPFVVPRPPALQVVGNLMMLQNLVCLPVSSNLIVWTMGIEIACYLAAPQLRRWPTTALVAVATVSAVAFAVYPRSALSSHGALHFGTRLYGLPLLLFAWAWLAGFILHRHRARPLRWGVAVAVIGGVVVATGTVSGTSYSIPTFAGVVLAVTTARCVPVPRPASAVLNYLGDLSYPLYLFHLPTLLIAHCILSFRGPGLLFVAAIAVSAAALFGEAKVKPVFSRWRPGATVPTRPAPADG